MAFCLGGAILCYTSYRGSDRQRTVGMALAGSTCSSSVGSPFRTLHRTCVAWALQTSITEDLKGITFQCDDLGSLRMVVDCVVSTADTSDGG